MAGAPTIHILDLKHLGQPRMIAAFLVVGPGGRRGGAVLVETGPASTYDTLISAMQSHGFTPADLSDVLLTHIHLDHAAAAGRLAAEPSFSGRIHVHYFGARHLIDPSRLIDSANRIYGQDMERLWGTLLPVPQDRVMPLHDGDVIESAGLRFTTIETPGHARHHCCFGLDTPEKPICFTGDAAGMIVVRHDGERRAGDAPFINLPTPPPEFDLELWLASVERMEKLRFGSLYLTHFGEVCCPEVHFAAVRSALLTHTKFISSRLDDPGQVGEQAQVELAVFNEYRDWVRGEASAAGISPHEIGLFVTDTLLRMNVDGIVRYAQKARE